MIAQISPTELAARLNTAGDTKPVLLDVREPWEFATCAIAGAVPIPMQEIAARLYELDRTQELVCICHHGMRSLQAGMFLTRNGFERVLNLSGGIDAWARDVQPEMPRY
jgi:rhodanese-related sulfurtransferase